jgi:hypothetical protein
MSRGMTIHPSNTYLWTPGQHQSATIIVMVLNVVKP